MKAAGYSALTGVKRLRGRILDSLRDTPLWRPLRAAFRGIAPLWRNRLVRGRELGMRVVRDELYPLNMAGQRMRFQVFEHPAPGASAPPGAPMPPPGAIALPRPRGNAA